MKKNTELSSKPSRKVILRLTLPVILPSLMMHSVKLPELPESNCSVRTTGTIQVKKKLKDYIKSTTESTKLENQKRGMLSNLPEEMGLKRFTKFRYHSSGIQEANLSAS